MDPEPNFNVTSSQLNLDLVPETGRARILPFNPSELHYAVYENNLAKVKKLIDEGHPIDVVTDFQETPLFFAIYKNFIIIQIERL